MKSQYKMSIVCKHNDPSQIIVTQEGEHICKCGVVIEERTIDFTAPEMPGRVSLYHQIENGSSPQDAKKINKKIHVHSSSVSEFSNICSKLDLSSFVQQRAWHIYQTFRSKTYYTRAKCALVAIYVACRESGQPIGEDQIKESIFSMFGVKNMPSVLGAISEMHDDALTLGIDTNTGHSSHYYLNLEISKKQHLFSNNTIYDKFKIIATNNFSYLSGNSQNKAKRAVKMALCEVGI